MRRTQLYLDEDVWAALKAQARNAGVTVSELVRQAVRDTYVGPSAQRKQAMLAFIGSRSNRTDIGDTEAYVRKLRKGSRLKRLSR